MKLSFAHDGGAGFEGVLSGLDTAKGFDPRLLNPNPKATHWVRYYGGKTSTLVPNLRLTGGTSTAACTLLDIIVEIGAFGTSDEGGILLVNDITGQFQAEQVTDEANGEVTIAQGFLPVISHAPAKAALITVEDKAIRFSLSGLIPDATAGTGITHVLNDGESYIIRGAVNLRAFRCVNAITEDDALVKYTLFY